MPETDTIPVSASIASTGLGIRIVGNYAYAYNTNTMANSSTTILDFDSGAGIIVGRFEMSGPISFTAGAITSGDTAGFEIKFNGTTIAYVKADSQEEDMSIPTYWSVILPPQTQVQVNTLNSSTSGDYTQSIAFTGRVYGAE